MTREELAGAAVAALRLLAVSLAFAAYALLIDHDRLLRSVQAGRRSALAVVLATRLVPTLERDAAGLLEALRGRGVAVAGARGHARLLSPLVSGRSSARTTSPSRWRRAGTGDPADARRPARRGACADRLALVAARGPGGGGSPVALASVEALSFSYPGDRPRCRTCRSSSSRARWLRFSGLPARASRRSSGPSRGSCRTFHGGRFEGRVEVCGADTRLTRPADLAGRVATVFQDPEDQVVFGRVEDEVAFGLENVGDCRPPRSPRGPALPSRLSAPSISSAGALPSSRRASSSASASPPAVALEPDLLLLDEPTSQLDPDAAGGLLRLARDLGIAVLMSEQRPAKPLEVCDRVLFLEDGRILLDADHDDALRWLARRRPAYLDSRPAAVSSAAAGAVVCRLEDVSFAYRGGPPVLERAGLELRRGEIAALTGPNGSGKTTLAKLAAGLLRPASGSVELRGRASYLSQDPGRYLVRDRVDEEVALGVGGDVSRAASALASVGLAGFEGRHPRDLSSGERERLALASVLVTEPDLLILDEPTRGVDPERKDELAALLRARARDRATLVVTHDLVFAAEVADRVVPLGVEELVHA